MLQGSDLGEPCRNGTYGQADNLASAEECTPCDPGSYCNGTALTGTHARLSDDLQGPAYTRRQRQCRVNAVLTLGAQLS